MRGKPDYTYVAYSDGGITPADAGKTCRCWALRRNYWDHPRGCGENFAVVVWFAAAAGSPPRMRGKPATTALDALDERITPAGAGKTAPKYQCRKPPEDHPRRCGENSGRKRQL